MVVFNSAPVGLALIIIAWILLLVYSKKGEIRKRFLIVYCLGCAWLFIDGIVNSDTINALLNLIVLGLVCATLIKVSKFQNTLEAGKVVKKKKKK